MKGTSIRFFLLTLDDRRRMAKPRKPNKEIPWDQVEDAVSMLENIRAYQLQDIFGKYKLF